MHDNNICIAKGDSAASSHYWKEDDAKQLTNITKNASTNVQLPNGKYITSSKQGELPLSDDLSPTARTATILPELKSSSLISLGRLCDDGCNIFLNYAKLYAIKNKKIVLEGTRNHRDGLWDIPIQKTKIDVNVKFPTAHAGMYPARKQEKSEPVKHRKHQPHHNKIIPKTENLEDIINKQLQEDAKKYGTAPFFKTINQLI